MDEKTKLNMPPELGYLSVEIRVDGDIVKSTSKQFIISEAIRQCVEKISNRVAREIYSSLIPAEIAKEIRDKVVNEHAENLLKGLVESDELARLRLLLSMLGVTFEPKGEKP